MSMLEQIHEQIDTMMSEHGITKNDLTTYWALLGMYDAWMEEPTPEDPLVAAEKSLWMTVLKADLVVRKTQLRMAGVPESELEAPDEDTP